MTNNLQEIEAAVLYEPGSPLVIESLELQPPCRDEVLVKIATVGVCRSDLHLMTGDTRHPLPVVPGHEGAGIIEAVGPGVTAFSEGDHVTLNWAPACRDCFYCHCGRPNLCETWTEPIWQGTMLDGTSRLSKSGKDVFHYCGLAAFAEHCVVPAAACVKMDPDIPFNVAALIGCAVATGVGAVLNTARVPQGSSVVVFGAGGVGLSILLAARLVGAEQIIVVDRSTSMESEVIRFGATHFVQSGEGVVERICELTAGRGGDYVFEAVGDPQVQQQSFEATRPGGTVVLCGLSPMGSQTNLPGALITRQEKTILGSYYGTTDAERDFPLYARYYQEGRLDLGLLVSRSYELSEINQAFEDLKSGVGARGVIEFA
ncbi:MAG: Zn-dependent alcohol dehydrogenase [Planctomycetales bacterium]